MTGRKCKDLVVVTAVDIEDTVSREKDCGMGEWKDVHDSR